MRKILALLIIILSGFASANFVFAEEDIATSVPGNVIETAGLQVSPQLIDVTAKAKDLLEYTVSLKNNSQESFSLYPLVNDLTAAGKIEFGDPNDLDKETSLARWIRVKRGEIDLKPGESYELPIKIEVALTAKPGSYHAAITFSQGSTVAGAESLAASTNQPALMFNAIIEDNIIEKAEIKLFKPDKNVFFKQPASLKLNINNIGNTPIAPQGTIIIYDRKGREVDSLKVNEEKKIISPNANNDFVFAWKPLKGRSLGKYQAKVNIEYGEKSIRDLSDQTFFWILPLKYLIAVLALIIITIIIFSMLLFRHTYHAYQPPAPENNSVINLKKK